jgi:exopolyphosphatase/pppGpp-phosphohydrolase
MLSKPINIVDIGGSGIRAVEITIDPDSLALEQKSFFEEYLPTVPSSGATYSTSEIRKINEKILAAHQSYDQKNDEEIHFLATAGLRSAANSSRIVQGLSKKDIEVSIIDPLQEAKFIGSAAQFFINSKYPEKNNGRILVSKTGGGSTEQIVLDNQQEKLRSLPIGIVAMSRIVEESPTKLSELVSMMTSLSTFTSEMISGSRIDTVVFSGRMMKRIAKAIALLDKRQSDDNSLTVDLASLQKLISDLETKTDSYIMKNYGIKASSREKYFVSAMAMKTTLDSACSNKALISPYSMREGFALEAVSAKFGAERLLV